jgi:hypothetical protein
MSCRLAAALVVALALAAGALVGAPAASASVDGPCTAEISGQDMSPLRAGPLDDPLVVDRDALVSVTMASERPLTRLRVELEFAGVRWTIHDLPVDGNQWASEVPVGDYGVYGMGLWKVVALTEGADFTCEATALISIEDDHPLDPLATITGLLGLGLALMGFLGTLAVAGRIGKTRAAPFSGIVLGVFFGIGTGVMLQQFSVVYPTVGVAGALAAAGAAFGLLFSVFGLPGRDSDARNPVRG